jgi:hypothetical protein
MTMVDHVELHEDANPGFHDENESPTNGRNMKEIEMLPLRPMDSQEEEEAIEKLMYPRVEEDEPWNLQD